MMQIDFTSQGNSDDFVVSGFSTPERLGRWTVGSESIVRIPVEGTGDASEIHITLLPLTATERLPAQTLAIEADGVVVHSGRHSDWEVVTFRVQHAEAAALTLKLLHPNATRPSAIGDSTDTRALGFFVKAIAIEPVVRSIDVAAVPVEMGRPDKIAPDAQIGADVSVGRDGWLFLAGGTNTALRYYTDAEYFTTDHAARWADLLQARQARLARMGVEYVHLGAPDKISVYPEYVRHELPNLENHPIRLLSRALAGRDADAVLVDPLGAFATHPCRDQLYLKTDTHWTYLAAMTVVELVAERLGHPRKLSLAGRKLHGYRHVFDLGSKIVPGVAESTFSVEPLPAVERIYANEMATRFEQNLKVRKPIVHNSINVVFRNGDPTSIAKTLVIFGDSFMDFQASNATMIFAENFREVHFIWSPRIDFGYVARVQADIVLSEAAERFMVQVPTDDYNLERETAQRLKAYPV